MQAGVIKSKFENAEPIKDYFSILVIGRMNESFSIKFIGCNFELLSIGSFRHSHNKLRITLSINWQKNTLFETLDQCFTDLLVRRISLLTNIVILSYKAKHSFIKMGGVGISDDRISIVFSTIIRMSPYHLCKYL